MPWKDKAKAKEYYAIPEVKAKAKERQSRPENREKAKEYYAIPENKARQKERQSRPENKAKAKEIRNQPENIAKHKESQKKYQSKPEYKAYLKEKDFVLKLEVFSHYSKAISNSNVPICACCLYDDIRALALDHIIPHSKLSASEKLLPRGGPESWNYLKLHDYPEGYQVLCANCNAMKLASPECPHQLDKVRKYWK